MNAQQVRPVDEEIAIFGLAFHHGRFRLHTLGNVAGHPHDGGRLTVLVADKRNRHLGPAIGAVLVGLLNLDRPGALGVNPWLPVPRQFIRKDLGHLLQRRAGERGFQAQRQGFRP